MSTVAEAVDWLRFTRDINCSSRPPLVMEPPPLQSMFCTFHRLPWPSNMQSGIVEVIFVSDKYHDKPPFIASRRCVVDVFIGVWH